MRPVVLLLVALTLSGCAFSSSSSSRTVTITTSTTETLYDDDVPMGTGGGPAVATFEIEIPPNATDLRIEVLARPTDVDLAVEADGCTRQVGNVQVSGDGTRIEYACGDPPAGAFEVTVRRRAGTGDVPLTATATVARTTVEHG